MILTLHDYWSAQGCLILQPYDMRMGAGTFHTATTLRALGPEPWNAAFVQPCRRPDRRPLRREPQPAAALLPVPGDPQAEPARPAGALPQEPRADRHRSAQARHPLRRGRLGKPDARRLGPRLGSVVRRDGGDPVHLLPADGRVRLQAGRRRADLRARAAGDVHPEQGQRVRPRLQRPRRDLRRRVPRERAADVEVELRGRRHRRAVRPVRQGRGRVPQRARRTTSRSPPTSRRSRPATCSTCSRPAA